MKLNNPAGISGLMCKLLLVFVLCITACKGEETKGVTPGVPPTDEPEPYGKAYISDLALIYGGGHHRQVVWNEASFEPHVVYTDRNDNKYWLFDSFLLIEFTLGKGGQTTNQIFATGYYGLPARKTEWQELLDYYFSKDVSIDALDKTVGRQIETIGRPAYKRQVVLTLPEPIVGGAGSSYPAVATDYWGVVEGKRLDFTSPADRLTACKWYIDKACEMFDAGGYENVELAGFYWVAEEMYHSSGIIEGVAEYLHSKGLRFEWIPYWKGEKDWQGNDPDYFTWKDYGFDQAYLQPNYFFNESVPVSRLTDAVKVINKYDLGYEVEFDENVIEGQGGTKRSRLYDYMKAFKESGVYAKQPLAYYMGENAFCQLSKAGLSVDRKTFDDLCTFVIAHQQAYLNERNKTE